jgi:hypothetical protein
MTAKEPAGRLHRWALTLQEFNFEVVYRPGRENSVAVALSRGPVRVDSVAPAEGETEGDDPEISAPEGGTAAEEEPKPSGTRLTMATMATAVAAQTPAERQVAAIRVAVSRDGGHEVEPTNGRDTAVARGWPHVMEEEIDRAADDVVRAVTVQRMELAELGVPQFTDEDVKRE